ncbi:MAG: glycosyltransferase [Paraglaciecola sp.]|uniref:glycosyltransferase n=1 Tax=Paraglaciecola sp. TaxID=1920173 RepID=UPI0032976D9F
MILVTVGTQIHFDRLIKYVEQWVVESNGEEEVVAQVGSSEFQSNNITVLKSLEPEQFEEYIKKCRFIISHAGMGSILTALRVNKPIIIFPRDASLGEHRNDHQLATARSFSNVDGVYVAKTQDELRQVLSNCSELSSGVLNESQEYKKLLDNIKVLVS